MPGAVQPPLEPRPPSVRISLRKRTIPKALQETPPSPSRPKKSSKTVSKKQGGKPSGGAKSKPQQSAGKVPPSETAKSRSSTKGKSHKSGKHSRPWEVDDGDDYVYDYISSPSESESSSSEEEYSLRASRPHVFLDDELDEESIANDTSLNYSDEDSPECSHLPWIDLSPDEIPPLELPESSKDIPIPSEYLMDTVELYELLRSYWRTLRLSPFIFEDFCAALCSPENSRLLSEIHIVLLRMSFKNDDEEQIHFSGNDTKMHIILSLPAWSL
ncbi:hypothetical protein KIN20_026863 [Parelaphostrongylus tenuis]|uniref:DDT domain-containing protein n=1 Tax=Parelaphostrongylus tenuis TaxID=148309 RepID=A0AAD5QYR1_PARTN|nr:hypothetical protein KIN20_026863 [Parelaphostrongylus tenuis]